MINPDNVFGRNQEVLSAESLNEILLLRPTTGQYYGLGETGSLVWSLLATPATVPEIAAKIAAAYGISIGAAEADVAAFLKNMADEGLLSQGAATPQSPACAAPIASLGLTAYSAPTLTIASLREAANGNHGYLDGGVTESGGIGGLASAS